MTRRIAAMAFATLCIALCTGCGWFDDDDDAHGQGGANGDATGAAVTGTAAPANGFQGAASNLPDLIDSVRASVVAVVVDQGEGSGVVWSSDGEIVTNEHVVSGASAIEVVLASGERIPATLVAADPLTDLAVIRVERDGLSAATFSEEVPRVGATVIAIGNPLGFENSVTQGIVSGLNRSIPSGGTTPALVDLIQTDAAISPGNSGGGLFDTSGQVVGINVAFIPPTEAAVSLGFAIPSVTVTDVIEQLLEEGTVEHSYMGIEPRAVTPQIASQLGLSVTEGVFVFSVSPGSPAEDAGVEPGDVIVEFDGKDITSVEDLFAALRGTSPGDSVPVRVVRGEQEQTLNVTLENRPAQ
jgi:S1-C subfamily serine protease